MKPVPWRNVEPYRLQVSFLAHDYGDPFGVFEIPHRSTGVTLRVVVATSGGWDHISVSLQNRTPNWAELDYVKRLFCRDDETMMQLHVPVTEHINNNPTCLHLWRPHDAEIPRPPASYV